MADFESDDVVRLLALEHSFCAVALLSAGNYSHLAGISIEEASRRFHAATASPLYDSRSIPKDVRSRMDQHIRRLFDHVAEMARATDAAIAADKRK